MKTINLTIALFLISYSIFAQTGPRVSPSTSTTGGGSKEQIIWKLLFEDVVLTKQELNFSIKKSDNCSKIKNISLSYQNGSDGDDVKFTVVDKSIYNLKPEDSIINIKVKLDEIIHDKKIICKIEWNFDGCKELIASTKGITTKSKLMTEAAQVKDENKLDAEQATQVQNINKPKNYTTPKNTVPQAQQARPANDEVTPPVTKTNPTEIWGLHILQQNVAIPVSGNKKD
jgi:hypothetical protein